MRIGPIVIERPLPGELDGTLDPQDYGIEVIKIEPWSRQEQIDGCARLYRETLAHTQISNPALDHYLREQSFDPRHAEALLARHWEQTYPRECRLGSVKLIVDDHVFDPTLTSASLFLSESWWWFRKWSHRHSEYVAATLTNPMISRTTAGTRVLDAFTGSGAFGIMTALRGAQVVSFDISSEAVACATKNAALNGVSQNVDVRLGSLHQCVRPGEQFDLVVANPPLLPGTPASPFEAALFDPGLQATKELIAALPSLLAKRGRCYLLTSDVIERRGYEFDIAGFCRRQGLTERIIAQHHRPYESYRVHEIARRRWRPLNPTLQQAITEWQERTRQWKC